jgi:hypothetical protein
LGKSVDFDGIGTDSMIASVILSVTFEICDSSGIDDSSDLMATRSLHSFAGLADSRTVDRSLIELGSIRFDQSLVFPSSRGFDLSAELRVSFGFAFTPLLKLSERVAETRDFQVTCLHPAISLHYSESAVFMIRSGTLKFTETPDLPLDREASDTNFVLSKEFDGSHSFDASHLRTVWVGSGLGAVRESTLAVVWLAVGLVTLICLVLLLLLLLRFFVSRRGLESSSEDASQSAVGSELSDAVCELKESGRHVELFETESLSGEGGLWPGDSSPEESVRLIE